MSEDGVLALDAVEAGDWAAVRRNFDRLRAFRLGRGPAQARVYNDANISVANGGAGTALTFNTARWDTGNFHNASSNTGRLTAPTAGLYQIGCCVQFAASSAGSRSVNIRLNGTTSIVRQHVDVDSAIAHTVNLVTTYQLDAAEWVDVLCFQDSGGALNVTVSGNFSPEFWIVRLGSQA